MLVEINNKTRSKIDSALIKRAVVNIIRWYYQQPNNLTGNKNKLKRTRRKYAIEVSIAFVGDKTIKQLNNRYRRMDKVTDVLAFTNNHNSVDLGEPHLGGPQFLGEVIINYQQVKRQARKYGSSVKKELVFILIHGLLHLLGYTDKTKRGKEEMEFLSQSALGKIYDKN